MAKSLDRLLSGPDDELIGGVFDLIVKRRGERIDHASIPEVERVVLLVWNTYGIVGNGGFRYLLESTFDGDPEFALTIRAFEAIDCPAACKAVKATFSLFPDSRPPRDTSKRLKAYLSQCKGWPTEQDKAFFAAGDDLTRCLAEYIRANAEAFRNPGRPIARPARPVEPERKRKRKSGPIIDNLPHWARVAYAAHCARTVLPLVARHWPEMSEEYRGYILTAIELAEWSAAEGRPADGLKQAQMHATMAAGAALIAGSAFEDDKEPRETPPANLLDGSIVSFVAKVAENAVKAAASNPDESLSAASSAWSFALQAAGSAEDEDYPERLQDDLERLCRVSERGRWTDRTRIPIDIWTML